MYLKIADPPEYFLNIPALLNILYMYIMEITSTLRIQEITRLRSHYRIYTLH